MGRITRRYRSESAPWDVLRAWAESEGFKLKHSDDVRQLYKRGIGVGVAPMYAQIIYTAPWAHIQVWVGVNLLVRPGVLFLAPSEMEPTSGGWRLSRSRRLAREAVNRLFERLGVDPIE